MPGFRRNRTARRGSARGAICPAIPAHRPVGTAGQQWAAFRDPLGAYPAEVVADQARAASQAAYPRMAQTETVRDAFRHFYRVSAMTRLLGPERARAFANSHEAEYPLKTDADRRSRQMDTYNNEAAIRMTTDPRCGAADRLSDPARHRQQLPGHRPAMKAALSLGRPVAIALLAAGCDASHVEVINGTREPARDVTIGSREQRWRLGDIPPGGRVAFSRRLGREAACWCRGRSAAADSPRTAAISPAALRPRAR